MKIGVIVEYNPMHNGHMLHLNEIKKKYKNHAIIACMSGNVTMRGEISVINKFDKTALALENGIDLIIELPLVYAMQNANIFSFYAVSILNSFHVDRIICGSEKNSMELFESIYHLENQLFFKESIKKYLDQGYSYPKAYRLALDIDLHSNDMLAYNYFKVIKENNYPIILETIQRTGSNYLDERISHESIASANAIRKTGSYHSYVPENVKKYLDIKGMLHTQDIYPFYKYCLHEKKIEVLKDIFIISEGIESRLLKLNSTYDQYINSQVTKRYTESRIKRSILYILFNITKRDVEDALKDELCLRILGYNDVGLSIIKNLKKTHTFYTNIKEGISKVLDIELKCSKILSTIYSLNFFELEQKGPIKK